MHCLLYTLASITFKLEEFIVHQRFTVLGLCFCRYKSVLFSFMLLFKNDLGKCFQQHKKKKKDKHFIP